MPRRILGVSGFYHDSAACLLADSKIVAAAQEERFTRKKHDPSFPVRAIEYCLKEGGIQIKDLDCVVFYDKPILTFDRLLDTFIENAPGGYSLFYQAMPVWLTQKLNFKSYLKKRFREHFRQVPAKILFTEHHESHAASAFFASPFEEAAVLCMDGVGEWATTSLWHGQGHQLSPRWEIRFPHSLGMLYSAFTYYLGFRVNSGEYKVMGLAPYGKPRFRDLILKHLIDLKPDGSFRLNLKYFDYCKRMRMTNAAFDELLGEPRRNPETELTQRHMDVARSIQDVTEEVVLRLARTAREQTGAKHLCLAGGVALNCVANGKILKEKIFDSVWVQPAAGDAGGALGAALSVYHQYYGQPRIPRDLMEGALLGPAYESEEITSFLSEQGIPFQTFADAELLERVADALAEEKVVGWFQGRMEFGPRALGARSILGDPRSTKMQSLLNLKIKYRESFRPFAPAITSNSVSRFFELDQESPYMLIVADVRSEHRLPDEESQHLWGIERLKFPRSSIPAITHVDYSARIQTVSSEHNPAFYGLLQAFERKTGIPILVNTSFNVRGEPLVCSPEDAYRCFMGTEMDVLVLGNTVLTKEKQPAHLKNPDWYKQYALD